MEDANKLETLLHQLNGYRNRGRGILKNIESHVSDITKGSLSDADALALGITSTRVCKRRFSLQDVADLLGMSRSAIHYNIEHNKIPDRPKAPDAAGRMIKVGYSLDQLWEIRGALNKLPRRDRMAIIGFLNQKGGVGKSTSSWMFGQYMALRGYRVLYIDTDPQGSLSFLLGYRPVVDVGYWDTFAPFLLQDVDGALSEFGSEEAVANLRYCIRPTHWPNIDIIPACNDLLELEVLSQDIIYKSPKIFEALTGKTLSSPLDLLREGVLELQDTYDVVIFDGTPSVNTSTMNIFSTCDSVLAPVPCSMLDFNSSVEFCGMISTILDSYKKHGLTPHLPDIHFLLAKFHNNAPSRFMEGLIKKTFGQGLLTHYAAASDEIQKLATTFHSIYEVNATADTNNPQALKRAKESYDALFDEIHTQILRPIMNAPYFS